MRNTAAFLTFCKICMEESSSSSSVVMWIRWLATVVVYHLGFFSYARQLDSFCTSSIFTTSLDVAKVIAPNLPRVDEFCNIL